MFLLVVSIQVPIDDTIALYKSGTQASYRHKIGRMLSLLGESVVTIVWAPATPIWALEYLPFKSISVIVVLRVTL